MVRSNPLTSIDAHEALKNSNTIRERVLKIIETNGPMTLDALVTEYVRLRGLYDWGPATEQGIRSRCAELVKAKRVEAVPDTYGASRFGRRAHLWRVVTV